MNGSSSELLDSPPDGTIASYWIQFGLSWPAVLLNLPVTVAMLASKNLRSCREMASCTVMSLFELVYALSFATASSAMLLNSKGRQPGMSAWDCMKVPYNSMIGFSTAAFTWSLVLLSVDRFICIISIKYYLKLEWIYVIALRVIPTVAGLLQLGGAWYGSSMLDRSIHNIHPASCFYTTAVSSVVIYVFSWINALPETLGSVVIYCAAILILLLKKRSSFDAIAEVQKRRQRKVTIFIGMITLVNLMTQVLPTLCNMTVNRFFPELVNRATVYIVPIKMTGPLFCSLVLWSRSNLARDELLNWARKVFCKTKIVDLTFQIGKHRVSSSAK